MSTIRKPLDLGGTVARATPQAKEAVAPPPPAPAPDKTDKAKYRDEATKTTTVRLRVSDWRKFKQWCLDNSTTAQETLELHVRDLVRRK